jgi:Domain of unknown function (DUF4159)
MKMSPSLPLRPSRDKNSSRNATKFRESILKRLAPFSLAFAILLSAALAQPAWLHRFGGGGWNSQYDLAHTPRDIPQHGDYETPYWTNTAGFDKDTFTFVRIKRKRLGSSTGGFWWTDTPDSDLNLAWRLQQLTAIKVNPKGLFLRLTDKELSDYPFIYMVEPGSLLLDSEEVAALRKYLLNGGFLWLDDFWGEAEWANVERVFKQVFPDRKFVELPLDHPLYHCVFDIQSKGQIPNVDLGTRSQYTGITWERPDAKVVHHRVIFDDKGRIMVFATHDTDNGDGWEWEGNNHYFFEHFSEKIAYPLAVNVIFYVMTH